VLAALPGRPLSFAVLSGDASDFGLSAKFVGGDR